jgi:hypothetical protein
VSFHSGGGDTHTCFDKATALDGKALLAAIKILAGEFLWFAGQEGSTIAQFKQSVRQVE